LKNHMKLSIIIPARNESENLKTTIPLLANHLDKVGITDFEMIVIDDGSHDATSQVVTEFHNQDQRINVIQNTGRNGFGRAIICGLNNYNGDAVVIYMADASDAPADVEKYYYVLRDEAECAFGSRFIKGSKILNYPKLKLAINRIANHFLRLLFFQKFNDFTNAFKGYRANVIEGCRPFISPHFNLTVELPLKALVRGYSFKVVPISWADRELGSSHLKMREQGSRYLFTVLSIWFEWLLTRNDYHRRGDIPDKSDVLRAKPNKNMLVNEKYEQN